ncbi:MAG: hypothetical protein LWW85_14490 [Marinilabiliales bacterium]|nr:hypothetical protein [Marinilabiliales bacterium]
MRHQTRYWKVIYWLLFAAWSTGALLFMARVKGGFFTNYLSDITFPPWFYIHIRGLNRDSGQLPKLPLVGNWFGITPERAFLSILIVGTLTEIKTFYLPQGIITGTFDPYDLLSYLGGLLFCYLQEKGDRKPETGVGKPT